MENQATNTGIAEENNTAVVAEFQSLQQKSQQLFDELRFLPQFSQKIWQPYFAKAFSLFTKANKMIVLHDIIFCFICVSSCGSSSRNTGEW